MCKGTPTAGMGGKAWRGRSAIGGGAFGFFVHKHSYMDPGWSLVCRTSMWGSPDAFWGLAGENHRTGKDLAVPSGSKSTVSMFNAVKRSAFT